MAEKACHAFASTTQDGLTQALGLMKRAFLTTLTLALLATLGAALVPFSQPLDASFQMDNPPLWVPASALLSLIGLPLALVALIGLLRFKRWARPLGLLANAIVVIALTTLIVTSPVVEAMAPLALGLAALALISWSVGLAIAYSKSLSGQFGP